MIYKVYIDGTPFSGMADGFSLLSGKVNLELNGAGSGSIKIPYNHQYYDLPQVNKSIVDIYENDNIIWTGRVSSITTNWNKEKIIEFEGALSYFNDSIQRPYLWTNEQLYDFLDDVITYHNNSGMVPTDLQFKIGNVTVTNVNVTKSVEYAKTFEVLQDLCIGAHGGYMFVRKEYNTLEDKYELYLDWYSNMPSTASQPVQFGLNLLDISTELSNDEVITRIIPISKTDDGTITIATATDTPPSGYRVVNDMLICDEAEDIFGSIIEVINFDGITDANTLLIQAVNYLKSKQFDHLSMECDVAELSYLNEYEYVAFELGDKVHVISYPHLIDKELVISRIEYDLMSSTKRITIGNPPRQTLSEITGTGTGGTSSSYSSSSGGGGGGGGGGSTVSVTPIILTGDSIADITVNGRTVTLKYDPSDLETEIRKKANSSDVYTKLETNALIESRTPEIIDAEVPQVVQYTKILQDGIKVGSITIGTSTDDIFTNTIFGIGEPSSSLGADGNIYIQKEFTYNTVEYVRTNYSQFGLTLSNWKYDLTDKFELIYKNNNSPKSRNDWPHILGAYNEDNSSLLFIQFNLYTTRSCLNITYNGQYTGDNSISFSSAFDYENYYLIGGNGGSFYIKRGSDLDHIDTTVATWSRTNGSGQINGAVKLYCDTYDGLSRPMDQSLYGIKVWNSDNELIHNYIPISDGVLDTIDMTTYVTDKTGHINGSLVDNDYGSHVAAIWYKDSGVWKKSSLATDGEIPELVTLTEEQYADLSDEEKMDLTKAFFVTDAVPTNNYVIPNPPYEPTRELNTIEINGLVYDIPGDIEPNPEEEPTDTLNTLKIDDTTYQLAGSGGSSGYNSNIETYTTTITTSQYGWISPVLDKDGNHLSADDDLLLGIDVDNSGDTYYRFEFLSRFVSSENQYLAKLINGNTNDVVGSAIQVTVTISYIKDFYKKGIISEASLSPVIYSTEEREIGVWTDGKPLYQKTINCGLMPNDTNWHDIPHNISNIDKVIDVNGIGFHSDTGEYYPIPAYRPSLQIGSLVFVYGEYIRFLNNWVTGNQTTLYTTVKYTKTTDVPGSGQYTTLGVPAVHYSTDEQVIGTWIDGKTLYQKTVALKAGASLSDSAWSAVTLEPAISNVDSLVFAEIHWNTPNNNNILRFCSQNGDIKAASTVTVTTSVDYYVTFKYTKTTD